MPTIINGRVTYGHINKKMKTLVNSSCNPDYKINKFYHKVKIIGDGHLKGLSIRLINTSIQNSKCVVFLNLVQVLIE
jgi:hypothetical protein